MPINDKKLIKEIICSRNQLLSTETVIVEVILHDTFVNNSNVCINGNWGAYQILQFGGLNKTEKILITAFSGENDFELRTILIPLTTEPNQLVFPLIGFSADKFEENVVLCSILNVEEAKLTNAYFEWALSNLASGKVITRYSESAQIALNYDELLLRDIVNQTLLLKLSTHDRDTQLITTVERTVAIINHYAIEKLRGILKPRIKYDFRLQLIDKLLVGSCQILNLEDEPIIFENKIMEYLFDDGEIVPPTPLIENIHLVIEPCNSITIECNIARKDLPAGSFGFAQHFKGKSANGLPAHASVYFEYYGNYLKPSMRDEFNEIIKVKRPDFLTLEKNVTTAPISRTRLTKKNVLQPEMQVLSQEINLPYEHYSDLAISNKSFGNTGLGEECIPDEESPYEDYVCQLTDEIKAINIPAKIVNARKGDVILSPGSDSGIGGLLKQVNPPQYFAHCGLMVQNYYTIRHSTASDGWLADAATGKFVDGRLGSNGLDAEKLKYIWPGTITQPIQQAFNEFKVPDPDGRLNDEGKVFMYNLAMFDSVPTSNKNGPLVFPLVVKPDPFVEASNKDLRPVLHEVAEEGKKIQGHYRFYCYSNASISNPKYSQGYVAPNRSNWWASNTIPTVCSSFVWSAIKAVQNKNIMLEGEGFITQIAELENSNSNSPDYHTAVDQFTMDGLYLYAENTRIAAGTWLFNFYSDEVLKRATVIRDPESGIDEYFDLAFLFGGLGILGSDAASDLGNQICNAFASDYTGYDNDGNHATDSERWKTPGPGRAVSPQDIKDHWDSPEFQIGKIKGLYGYSENLIYRPARQENHKVSRWVKVTRTVKIHGFAVYNGQNQFGAVIAAHGSEILTNENGYFELEIKIGDGNVVLIQAGKTIDDWYMNGETEVAINDYNNTDIVIELKAPPEIYREIQLTGKMIIKDLENWPDTDVIKTFDKPLTIVRLDKSTGEQKINWIQTLDGEIRAEVYLTFNWQKDLSVKLTCNVLLFEGTTVSTTDLDGQAFQTHVIPKDSTKEIKIFVRNDDEDDDDHIDLTLNVKNLRQA